MKLDLLTWTPSTTRAILSHDISSVVDDSPAFVDVSLKRSGLDLCGGRR